MNNQSAFPRSIYSLNGAIDSQSMSLGYGMTLRDYFAAKAMQALIDKDTFFDDVAESAYKVADHMLKAREA